MLNVWFMPWLWYTLPSTLPPQLVGNEISRTVCFMLLLSLVSLVTSLPWSYYSTCRFDMSVPSSQREEGEGGGAWNMLYEPAALSPADVVATEASRERRERGRW